MAVRPEDYKLDVPEADGLGEPFPCRHLTDKCVQFAPFTGTLRLLGTVDRVSWPVVHEEVGDGTGDGAVVPLPLALRAVRVERDGVAGAAPAVTLAGLLVG